MKGIILAGGAGTRLHPLTRFTSKQLLPVYDKPMIYYPLTTLMLAGVREILVITTAQDQPAFRTLLGDGSQWGLAIDYAVQERPEGVAQAYHIAADFVRGGPSCLALGDNILFGHGLPRVLAAARSRIENGGAAAFAHYVRDPERYGVVSFAADGQVAAIHEKPKTPLSKWAVIGVYFYGPEVVDLAQDLSPSPRGEYEITDLNALYLARGQLAVERLGRGFAWFDAGTHDALLDAAEFVRMLETRQGQKIACPEEVAFRLGFVTTAQYRSLVQANAGTPYGDYLRDVVLDGDMP